jgi:hypothetical protein
MSDHVELSIALYIISLLLRFIFSFSEGQGCQVSNRLIGCFGRETTEDNHRLAPWPSRDKGPARPDETAM